jgi:release factor glutamine methyltransferase
VFAEEEAAVIVEAAGGDGGELERLVRERVSGRPLEHLVGWAAFAGLRVVVEAGVFVPRRRTDLLVREAVREAPDGAVVVDLCCGSGAIGAAIAAYGEGRIRLTTDADGDTVFEAVPAGERGRGGFEAVDGDGEGGWGGFEVVAADVDGDAVASARRNLGAGRVFQGDLFGALPVGLRGRVDVLVVNAPYVPSAAIATMPAEARLYEAGIALDGGGDGLDVQRRIVAGAREWLSPGGRLLIETSEDQAPLTAALFEAAGLAPRVVRDESLDATVVVGHA